jgi:haloacetate dehalogenase
MAFEGFRAGAGFDRDLDWADKRAEKKIAAPLQALWGAKGAVGNWYDPLAVWREWAHDVRGQAIDCGHFLPEENPAETLAALREFFLDPLIPAKAGIQAGLAAKPGLAD